MAKFSFTGREAGGALTEGVIDATDEMTAAKMLLARSVTPIKIQPQNDAGSTSREEKINFLTPPVELTDLVIFCRQMYSLTKAGIPILRAVSGLAESCTSLRLREALTDVIAQLERGRSFSSALNQHPKIFNQLFVSIIHVGENTGRLDESFVQLAEYLEREQETRKQIKSATRYPLFVVIALVGAFVIMNIFVIPKFANMFSKFGAELPLMTRILIGMSDFMINYWPLLLVVIGGVFFGLTHYVKTEAGRMRWDRLKLRMPIVGSIINRSLLGRYCRSFSMMLRLSLIHISEPTRPY